MRKTKVYKNSEWLKKVIDKKLMTARGWRVVEEKEVEKRSFLKTGFWGLLFLPLALLGKSKATEVTFERL